MGAKSWFAKYVTIVTFQDQQRVIDSNFTPRFGPPGRRNSRDPRHRARERARRDLVPAHPRQCKALTSCLNPLWGVKTSRRPGNRQGRRVLVNERLDVGLAHRVAAGLLGDGF